ncbi:MAG: GNAT family N-acetyltransferase [Verrucomicrobia bacterium]|nr:GNAT family N-acetyltransferase [Verrucomicrobiota bacterium]MBV8278848.1 GNAT family N-acetyltransferase [Verrucomicrobiota bacterium]
MIRIRPVRIEDAEAIINLLNPLIEAGESTALDTVFTAEEERIFISEFPVRGVFHAAEQTEDGTIVGFQNVEPFATYTDGFAHVGVIGTYVERSGHRQGIGRLLFEATRLAAKDKGYEKFFAFVRADNVGALAFYKRIGFEVIGVAKRHAKIKGRYIDEVMIEREL